MNLGVAAFVTPTAVDRDDGGTEGSDEAGAGAADPSAGAYLMDPQLFETPDGEWAVGSSLDGVTMPLMAMADDGTARPEGGALRSQPAWAAQGFVGPSVVEDGGTWWLLYAAQANDTGRYCLGVASTTDVSQGFEPASSPLRCADDRDLVDPSVHRGPDGLALTWAERRAGATSGSETTDTTTTESWRIVAAPLGLAEARLGDVSTLLTGEPGGWEGGTVDGPALADVDGTLVLLYGGNVWGSEAYAAGYAVCESTQQRCERRTVDAPLEVTVDEAASDLSPAASLQPVLGGGDDVEVAGFALRATADGQTVPVALRAAVSWRDDRLEVGQASPIAIDAG